MKINTSWIGALALMLTVTSACGTDDTATGRPRPANNTTTQDMTPGLDMSPDMKMTGDMDEADQATDMNMAKSCDANSDCTAPEVCGLNRTNGERTCAPPTGPGLPGDMCTMGNECQSNLCVNGACASPCATVADCPNGFSCVDQSIPLTNGQAVNVKLCIENKTPCQADGDCAAPTLCTVDRSGAMVELTCQAPVPGGGALGAACAMDAQCLSNLCLDNVCAKPCERPNDCAADGSFICEPTTITTATNQQAQVNLCKPKPADQCLSNSQCFMPQQCVADRGPREIQFTCDAPNQGGKALGDACTQDSECGQNLCLDGQCTLPCQGNGDCAAQPGYSCKLREVTLQNNNKDNVQVCVPPTTCDDKGDCKVGEECYVTRTQTGADFICRPGNQGGGVLGQVCAQDSECATNLCFSGRFGNICSSPCDDNSDCASPGYECRATTIKDANGQPFNARVCAPQNPAPCSTNDQCPTGTSCAILANTAGNALESVCIPKTGRLAPGVPCQSNDQCENRVCLNNICSAPCTDTMQCAVGQVCRTNTVMSSNLSGQFNVCEQLLDQDCTDTGRCNDGVRVCGDIRQVGQDVRLFCRFPIGTGAQLGSACMMNNQCREGLCQPFSNECSVGCGASSDCSAAAGQICTTYSFSQTNQVSICTESCVDNASCSNGNVCTINGNPRTNAIDQICQEPRMNGKNLGESCMGGNDCSTGICLTTQVFDPNGPLCVSSATCMAGQDCVCPVNQPNCVTGKRCAQLSNLCTRVCNDAGDCTGGAANNELTACSPDVFVQNPNGMGSSQISVCAKP